MECAKPCYLSIYRSTVTTPHFWQKLSVLKLSDEPRGQLASYIVFYLHGACTRQPRGHQGMAVPYHRSRADRERPAGQRCCLLFFAVLAGLMTGAAHVGVAIAGLA